MLEIRLLEARGEADRAPARTTSSAPSSSSGGRSSRHSRSTDGAAPVLLIDEIDRADEEFEAYLLEILSDFQVTVPEIGTIRAELPPRVILTSNRTREVHDALKRRCLYHWIDYPTAQKEYEIVLARVPGAPSSSRARSSAFVHRLREADLTKVPGIAETLDWAAALLVARGARARRPSSSTRRSASSSSTRRTSATSAGRQPRRTSPRTAGGSLEPVREREAGQHRRARRSKPVPWRRRSMAAGCSARGERSGFGLGVARGRAARRPRGGDRLRAALDIVESASGER